MKPVPDPSGAATRIVLYAGITKAKEIRPEAILARRTLEKRVRPDPLLEGFALASRLGSCASMTAGRNEDMNSLLYYSC